MPSLSLMEPRRLSSWLAGMTFTMLIGATLFGAAGWAGMARAQTSSSPVILELFTSQGCNSCPPADALMAEWAKLPGILPLSLHVDYWDYLGWKDTFGKKGHSNRQQEYARHLGSRQIYTPQAVIDGQFQAIGSDRKAVQAALSKARQEQRIALQAERSGNGGWQVRVPAASVQGEAELVLCRYDRRHEVAIERGENTGRTVTYLNVARAWNRFGRWSGSAASYTMPDLGDIDFAKEGVVIMLQSLNGAILGAVDLKPAS